MEKIIGFFKQVIPNRTFLFKMISFFIVISFMFTYITSAINHQQVLIPHNPLENPSNESSYLQLSKDVTNKVHAEEIEKEEEQEQEKKEEQENESEGENENENENENEPEIDEELSGDLEESEHESEEKSPDKIEENTPNEKVWNSIDSEGVGKDLQGNEVVNPEALDIEVKDSTEEEQFKENEYFTTSIINGETVTDENYAFVIKQKEHNYLVEKIEVFLNGIPEKFNGSLKLEDGENTIKIQVTYEGDDGGDFTVSRHYQVYLEQEEIIIYSNLEDQLEVTQSLLIFKASAEISGKNIPIEVYLNENELPNSEEYEAVLVEGKNEITITAVHKDKQQKKMYTIFYHKPIAHLEIETDLKNQEVSDPSFSFQAIAKEGEEKVELFALLNGENIAHHEESYAVTLSEGENAIQLTAKGESGTITEDYIVTYIVPDNSGNPGVEENENAPTIEVYDLTDGETIKNSIRKFHISARNYNGQSITGGKGSIIVKNNGEHVYEDWNDSSKISFTLMIQNGPNHIVITAKDQEGNIATHELTIYGEVSEDGAAVGSITISLEATTIGLGHLIAPKMLEIYQGERASYVLDRYLKDHGFSYEMTGKIDTSFYLAHIFKSGMISQPSIPSDLAELLERDMVRFEPDDYYPDSLGEFDFSNGSGWMYSVNGYYPNVGFADYYFKDGDVVRIRFTLAYGADIGAGMPGTNYHKEW